MTSCGHKIEHIAGDRYRLVWVVAQRVGDVRLPARKCQRETDRAGAERFSRRWGVPGPWAPTVNETLAVRDRLLAVLERAQSQRGASPVGWIEREQRAMLDAVNDERQARGFVTLTLGDLQRIEQRSLGHSDYTSKFALHCAQVATSEGWKP